MALRLLIASDVHLSLHKTHRHQAFRYAVARACEVMDGLDGVILVGDGTDYGMPWEYFLVKRLFKQGLADAEQPTHAAQLVYVLGNHEYRLGLFSWALHRFMRHTKKLRAGAQITQGHPLPYFETSFGSLRLLCLAGDERPKRWDAARLSQEQLVWLDARLSAAEAAKVPAFVFCHEPLFSTVDGSFPGQDSGLSLENGDSLRAVMEKHPTAVLCTGHSHHPIDMAQLSEKGPLCVNVGAIGFDARYNEDFSQGVLVEEAADGITLRGYDFYTDRPIEEKTRTLTKYALVRM